MTSGKITINSLKYDGTVRRSWQAGLVTEEKELLVAVGVFSDAVRHTDLGLIEKGTISFEYFWLDRWYNVFRFVEPDGRHRNYYCNIAMPPSFDGATLNFIDLDIDVVVWADGTREVLDREDFAANVISLRYPDDVIQNAEGALAELLSVIDREEFPFNEATGTGGPDV
jgi:protein associated with RNAse G/E